MRTILLQSIKQNLEKAFVLNGANPCSYRDLFNLLSKLNKTLYSNNYKKVMISAPQGFYAYGSILASYLTNATFCVIDQDIPLERKIYIINQFEPDVMISQTNANLYSESNVPNVNLESINYHDTENDFFETDFPCFDNEIIYVYFTSGSTGTPKGCCINRVAVEKIVLWAISEFGLKSNEVWGQYTPLHFDMSLIDVFGATCLGASLVSFSTVPDKLRPGNLICRHKITFLNIVPQVIDILKKAGQLKNEYCQSLSVIRFGGDKVYTTTLEELFYILPDLTVVSTYGPTETTFFCTSMKMNRKNYTQFSTDILTMGIPIPGCHIEIDNAEDGIGEIIIYGEYVGLGYLGIENLGYNSIEIDGKISRFYRTGDYAKKIQDCYYYCGRRDAQIKINGQRFSLVEIEVALKKAGCDECAAIYIHNTIVCYYVDNKNSLNKERLNESLKQFIPEIFLPKKYIIIEKMPYNANGKIDRVKLNKLFEKE